MKLMTGLVEVAVMVSVQLQTTQRRYDMENSKRAHDRASDRVEELQATISEVTLEHLLRVIKSKHTYLKIFFHVSRSYSILSPALTDGYGSLEC